MFTAKQIATLSVAYSEATGRSLSAMGRELFNDHHFFRKLIGGSGCNTKSAERASLWLTANWPHSTRWPDDVPDRRAEQAAE